MDGWVVELVMVVLIVMKIDIPRKDELREIKLVAE